MTGALRIDKTIMVAGINPSTGGNELLSVTTFDPPAERIDGIYMLAGIAPDGSNVLLRLNSDGTLGSSGGSSLPSGGLTSQFLRGDGVWSNVLTDDFTANGHAAIGANAVVDQSTLASIWGVNNPYPALLSLEESITTLGPSAHANSIRIGHEVNLSSNVSNAEIVGIALSIQKSGAGNLTGSSRLQGLNFTAYMDDGDLAGELTGIVGSSEFYSGTITNIFGANLQSYIDAATASNVYGIFTQTLLDSGSVATNTFGLYIYNYNPDSTTTNLYASYIHNPSNAGGTIGNYYGYYTEPLNVLGTVSTAAYSLWFGEHVAVGGAANSYFQWFDSPGVYRVKSDGVMAYYNPTFTKYVPGAANFERVVQQWNANVLEYGTEVGAGGGNVLRPVRLIGPSVQVMGTVAFNGATPAARPDYTVTNPSVSRALDVGAATLAELRAVVGTLAADLIAIGLLQ